jgi:hypothetical protein
MNVRASLVWITVFVDHRYLYSFGEWELRCYDKLAGTLSTTGNSGPSTTLHFEVSRTLGGRGAAERAVQENACVLIRNKKPVDFASIQVDPSPAEASTPK